MEHVRYSTDTAYPILGPSLDWEAPIDTTLARELTASAFHSLHTLRQMLLGEACLDDFGDLGKYVGSVNLLDSIGHHWLAACAATAIPVYRAFVAGEEVVYGSLAEMTLAYTHLGAVLVAECGVTGDPTQEPAMVTLTAHH